MAVWVLPILIVATTIVLSIPVGYYMAWINDGRYRAPGWLQWLEGRFNTGPQSWKRYTLSLLLFHTMMFVFGFAVLSAQPLVGDGLNPDSKGMLAPTTIFNTVTSFLTNTNLQDYSGEVHLSYFSQLVFVVWNMFVSAGVGYCALAALTRGLRGDPDMGNFYLDLWRIVVYIYLPVSLVAGAVLMAGGVPMTLEPAAAAATVEAGAMGADDNGADKPQTIARGPVAAVMPIKHFGTNGGGFFGANSAHPFENPSGWTNFFESVSIMIFPFSLVVMFGRMLNRMRHAAIVYVVMLLMFSGMVGWAVATDTQRPNPATRAQVVHPEVMGEVKTPLVALPVAASVYGNLEGKELRFGPSAGATFCALTTAISCGSVNCMHDSLNPLTGLTPFTGMWLNCVFGGKGVGLINLLVYLIVGVFLSGLMVGRTPEYLGKKVEAKEMKLAMLALLIHPMMILGPTGLFSAMPWLHDSENNPGAHGFSEGLYQFSSSSANNGSGFEGLADTWGFNDPAKNPSPPGVYSRNWDIATGLVMMIGRFIPIIAPLAIAGSLAAKKPTPFTTGTMRTDTVTFGFVLIGTILLVGALLFMPAAVLGPVAEHLGPMPFGG
jgi:potassium-transporting ATPase potassium-binding subunit